MEFQGVTLYHYTDYAALEGILRDGELRVNNVLYMNDAKEMRLFMEALCHAVCEELQEDGCEDKLEEVTRLFDTEMKKQTEYSAYAACFSLYRDDAAQWERYGNKGRGVCIGFSGELLQEVTYHTITLQTVYYRDNVKEHELVSVICEMVKNGGKPVGQFKNISAAVHNAWACSTAFKHPSFSCEKEVRLVTIPSDKTKYLGKAEYHVSKYRIKKYYPLDLASMCRQHNICLEDLIDEIMIGPDSTQPIEILQDYFRDIGKAGLADKVCLSECPLR